MKRLLSSPLHVFSALSLVLVLAMVIAVSSSQSRFFKDAVIQREAVIMHDMVTALVRKGLSGEDLIRYREPSSQSHFQDSLDVLTRVSGVVRLKVYDAGNVIVWSDEPSLISVFLPKSEAHLTQVWAGRPSDIFDPTERETFAMDRLPAQPLIEFYVPFTLNGGGSDDGEIKGVVAVYRSAESLLGALDRGRFLLWLMTATGGLLLFFALFHLFRSVYLRQRKAESEFALLASRHERIVQMEKLSAMGQMVVEIAHQFNNPMVGVIGLTQVAERHADNPARVRELLGEIRKAGDHCHGFVQRMLRFAQLAKSEPQPTEIVGLVRDTIAFFGQSAGNTPVDFRAPRDQLMLRVDPVLLRHALFNLLSNAAQADPAGPIAVSLEEERRDGVAGWTITVSDHGPGLSAEVEKHLFTPFFTTHEGGTGLGLPVAQHIVALHGGDLRAENNREGGARFTVWLPAEEGHETQDPAGR